MLWLPFVEVAVPFVPWILQLSVEVKRVEPRCALYGEHDLDIMQDAEFVFDEPCRIELTIPPTKTLPSDAKNL